MSTVTSLFVVSYVCLWSNARWRLGSLNRAGGVVWLTGDASVVPGVLLLLESLLPPLPDSKDRSFASNVDVRLTSRSLPIIQQTYIHETQQRILLAQLVTRERGMVTATLPLLVDTEYVQHMAQLKCLDRFEHSLSQFWFSHVYSVYFSAFCYTLNCYVSSSMLIVLLLPFCSFWHAEIPIFLLFILTLLSFLVMLSCVKAGYLQNVRDFSLSNKIS